MVEGASRLAPSHSLDPERAVGRVVIYDLGVTVLNVACDRFVLNHENNQLATLTIVLCRLDDILCDQCFLAIAALQKASLSIRLVEDDACAGPD